MTLLIAINDGNKTYIAGDKQTTRSGLSNSLNKEVEYVIESNHNKWIKGKDCYVGLCGPHDKISQFVVALRKCSDILLKKEFSKNIDEQQPQVFDGLYAISKFCKDNDIALYTAGANNGTMLFPLVVHGTIYDCRIHCNSPNTTMCMQNLKYIYGSGETYAQPILDYLLIEEKMNIEESLAKTFKYVSRWCKSVGEECEIIKIQSQSHPAIEISV